MKSLVLSVRDFVRDDWREHPLRCALEITAWILSIACSVTMALTLPNPPFLILYPLFITQCVIFAWACKTRGSTGLLANYLLLITIDSMALIRLLAIS